MASCIIRFTQVLNPLEHPYSSCVNLVSSIFWPLSSREMLLSRFVLPLVASFLVPCHVFVSMTSAEDARPNPSVACSDCTICPYPCYTLPPPPPPPPPATAYPVYKAPPPPLTPPLETPVQGNCPPGQVISCCPSSNPVPPYTYGTYGPPTPPLGYQPYESHSALALLPPLHISLMMMLLLLFQLSVFD